MALLLPFLLLLVGIALLFRVDLYFTVVWFLTGAYVLARLWARRAVHQIEVNRAFEDHAFTDDRVAVELRIHNRGPLPIPWLEIGESIPVALRETPFPSQVISLGPRRDQRCTYTLRCRARGYYELGPLRAEIGDVLGVEQRLLTIDEPRRLTVYPRIVPLDRLGLPTRSALVTLASRVPLFEDPARIIGVRDYQLGDSPRRMHWTASARAGRLLVKKFQPAIARETLICLDLDLVDYALRARHEATEQAIVVAASLAHHMIVREGLPVGLATEAHDTAEHDDADPPGHSSGKKSRRRRMSLAPGAERSTLMHILEALARAGVAPGEGFVDLLRQESINLSWGATVIVITGDVDDRLAESLLYLKRSGHALALILVRPRFINVPAVPAGIPVHHVWQERDLAVLA
jgi:uncharacterized protein (DUF58 family)